MSHSVCAELPDVLYNTCCESAEIILWSNSFKGVHPQGTRNPQQVSSVSTISFIILKFLIPTVEVVPSLHLPFACLALNPGFLFQICFTALI